MISPKTLERSQQYSWPGNIRELENTIRSRLVLGQDNVLSFQKIETPEKSDSLDENANNLNFKERVSSLEKELVIAALHKSGNNKAQAARLLGINRRLLYSKVGEYEIEI
jgi:DNA-binding NtrC family response regulator